jgi:hypothetical protein
MEILLYLVLGAFGFFVWMVLSIAIFRRFQSSKGISSFFWFALWVLTLSFIFGNSQTLQSGTHTPNNSEGDNAYDDGFSDWWDSNSYEECDYNDYSNDSYSFDDD